MFMLRAVLASLVAITFAQVDLGYGIYQGYTNTTSNLQIHRGIRYAAPPVGELRWQSPQPPVVNRSSIVNATLPGSQCPQGTDSPLSNISSQVGFESEDCLYLNIFAPVHAKNLPVLVWIHGGGYGEGNGSQDLSQIINSNNNSFVGVAIQYRLGAFGFLSSDEVFRKGVVNAGIRDQLFALQWVQDHISKFGGDASRVTISGESAGGGSVMLLDMAFGGSLGNTLFTNSIAASPYLPMQYGYKDWVPSQSFYAFASLAGCPPFTAYGGSSQTIFECLQGKDTDTLQAVNRIISASGTYGTWGFLPVTDGMIIQQLPSQQLHQKSINGQRILVGNNANEGLAFTMQDIETEDDLVAWLQSTFPLFTNDDISKILLYYPSTNASVNPAAPIYATNGETGATALNESSAGTGQQQRANNIYAETTFVCPGYWLVEAYSDRGRSSYKYQYSVPVSTHGADVAAYFGPGTPNQSPDFKYAFMKIWGNFITQNDPSISDQIANGIFTSNSSEVNPASSWPAFNIYAPYQINLNETGGTEVGAPLNATFNSTQYVGPGLRNHFTLVDSYRWEGGRGFRCDFWKMMGTIVPE